MRRPGLLGLLAAAALLSALLALSSGSVAVHWETVFGPHSSPLERELLLHLRLPRVANAFTSGALLAVSGALMQVLLKNPLADPYVLGLSGGASVAALGAMMLGLGATGTALGAFFGALGSMLLVFGLSGRGARLLLTGVVLASGWGALVTLLLSLSPDSALRGMLFWLTGNLDNDASPIPGLVGVVAALLLALPVSRDLDILGRGDEMAKSLGVEVERLRARIFFLCALATSVAVMTAGSIGFVGLVVPHGLRLLGGSGHRMIVPGSALLGGTLVVLADTLARTAIAPNQLPTGAIMALIGVPMFLYLLAKKT